MAWMPKRKYSTPRSSHWSKHTVRRTASGENMMFGKAQCNWKKHLALEVLAGEKKLPHFWSQQRFAWLLVDWLFSAVKKRQLNLEAQLLWHKQTTAEIYKSPNMSMLAMMLCLYKGLNQTRPQHFRELAFLSWLSSRTQTMLACIIFALRCWVQIDPI